MIQSQADLISEADACNTIAELHGFMKRYAASLGFEYCIYATMLVVNPAKPLRFAVSAYPKAWRDRYEKMGYLAVDPVIQHCMSNMRPVFWDEVALKNEGLQSAFFRDAAEHGLVSGMTSPVIGKMREIGAFSMASSQKMALSKEQRGELLRSLHWFAMLVCEAFERLALSAPLGDQSLPLSDRETDVLGMVSSGYCDREIAQSLGLSERTVRHYIDQAGIKLGGVTGRHQIVARAREAGRFSIEERSLISEWATPEVMDFRH